MRISERCEPTTEPVLVHPNGFSGVFSVGLVDEQLIFSFLALTGDPDRPLTAYARWFDAELAPTTDLFWLGDGRAGTSQWRWARHEGRLWAQIWVVPEPSGALPPIRSTIAIYAVAPGSMEFERVARDLPIATNFDDQPDLTPVLIGSTTVTAGRQAFAGAGVGHGRPIFVLSAIPGSCEHFAFGNASRLFVFDAMSEFVNQHGDDPCSAMSRTRDEEEHDATLVELSDGGLGVLYRLGVTRDGGRLWYARVNADLHLDGAPRLVSSTTRHFLTPGGYQARAAQLERGPILFTERTDDSDANICSNLRLVNADGGDARNAAWQLGCRPPEDAIRHGLFAPWLTEWIAVEPLASGHAAIAYGERTNFVPGLEYVTPLSTAVEWNEGVFLATVDAVGRRASEIVRVTPPESTHVNGIGIPRTEAGGPYPGDFPVVAATEGDTVVVAWHDLRQDAPGYYARRYRCTPIGE